MNKATRLNRNMGLGMLALGIVVLAIVFGLLYIAFQNTADRAEQQDKALQGDSITLIINQ